MTALHTLGAVALSRAFRTKALSPVEVAQAVLAQAERCEPQLHATYLLRPEQALAQARASEERWRRSAPLSDLDGVPVTIKDNIATQGDPLPLGTA
ncbi:MAG: amidase family protein, partial [Burkholderiaceae bacterium]